MAWQARRQHCQATGAVGGDGMPPKSGSDRNPNANPRIYALEDVDLFNLLCIPRAALDGGSDSGEFEPTEAQAVISVAEAYCAKCRVFFLVTAPER